MANGNQMEQAIAEARSRMASQGYEDVDIRDIMLVGFGYLAGKIEKTGVRININPRIAVPATLAAGGTIVGALRLLGVL